jgi:hypothetical protein
MGGKVVVQLDGEHMGGAGGEGRGNGACAGAYFHDGAAGKVAERNGDTLHGLRVIEEVLSELGFRGHVLL